MIYTETLTYIYICVHVHACIPVSQVGGRAAAPKRSTSVPVLRRRSAGASFQGPARSCGMESNSACTSLPTPGPNTVLGRARSNPVQSGPGLHAQDGSRRRPPFCGQCFLVYCLRPGGGRRTGNDTKRPVQCLVGPGSGRVPVSGFHVPAFAAYPDIFLRSTAASRRVPLHEGKGSRIEAFIACRRCNMPEGQYGEPQGCRASAVRREIHGVRPDFGSIGCVSESGRTHSCGRLHALRLALLHGLGLPGQCEGRALLEYGNFLFGLGGTAGGVQAGAHVFACLFVEVVVD
jgi:hypothetical protein